MKPSDGNDMEASDFRQLVYEDASDDLGVGRLSKTALDVAIAHYVKQRDHHRTSIPGCIALGMMIAATGPLQLSARLTPALLTESERRARVLTKRVELVRMYLFRAVNAPFGRSKNGLEQAAAWIEKAREEWPNDPDSKAIGQYVVNTIGRTARGAPARSRIVAHVLPTRLPYLKPSSRAILEALVVPEVPEAASIYTPEERVRRAPLRFLLNAVRSLAKDTDFYGFAITAWVLNGLTPVLPPVIVEKRSLRPDDLPPEEPEFRSVLVTFNSRDLQFDELRDVYRAIRSDLGSKAARRITADERALLDLVAEMGGPPVRPTERAFWEEVLKRWRVAYPHYLYKGWRSIQTKHARLMKRLHRPLRPSTKRTHGKHT
jgi:hypothetical protein